MMHEVLRASYSAQIWNHDYYNLKGGLQETSVLLHGHIYENRQFPKIKGDYILKIYFLVPVTQLLC